MTANKTIDETKDYLVTKRYSTIQRFQHWSNLSLMLILFVTGFQIWLGFGPTYVLDIHLWAGFLVFLISWVFYTFIVIYEKKITEIIPNPRDFLDVMIIMGCAFGILSDDKYPHYDFYDKKEGKYINKYHPTQKFLATINWVMLFFIAMSGFALYGVIVPDSFTFMVNIGTAVMTPFVALGIPMRFLHFLIFTYFLLSTMIHFYFTMLPQNRSRLKGMATGKEKIPKD